MIQKVAVEGIDRRMEEVASAAEQSLGIHHRQESHCPHHCPHGLQCPCRCSEGRSWTPGASPHLFCEDDCESWAVMEPWDWSGLSWACCPSPGSEWAWTWLGPELGEVGREDTRSWALSQSQPWAWWTPGSDTPCGASCSTASWALDCLQ